MSITIVLGRACASTPSGRPRHRLQHDGRVGQHGDDDVHVARHIGDALAGLRARAHQVLDRPGVDVVDDQLETFAAQIQGHAASHPAQADEPDLH
jgi:hypothetical protein